jgi:hypothetical protein
MWKKCRKKYSQHTVGLHLTDKLTQLQVSLGPQKATHTEINFDRSYIKRKIIACVFNSAKEYIRLDLIFLPSSYCLPPPSPTSRHLSLTGYTERKKTQRGKDGGSNSTG